MERGQRLRYSKRSHPPSVCNCSSAQCSIARRLLTVCGLSRSCCAQVEARLRSDLSETQKSDNAQQEKETGQQMEEEEAKEASGR